MFGNKNHLNDIINKIVEHINKKLPQEKATLIAEFARQYLATAALEDLTERGVLDLYGAVLSVWELLSQRHSGESKIRIYNPHYEQHGWQSTHTIIEIAHDDMPFLVDSIRMQINREGFMSHFTLHMGGLKVRRDPQGNIIEVLPSDALTGNNILTANGFSARRKMRETAGVYTEACSELPAKDLQNQEIPHAVKNDEKCSRVLQQSRKSIGEEYVTSEAPIYIEIDRQTQPEILENLKKNIEIVLTDVRHAVEDWSKMREKMRETLNQLEDMKPEFFDVDELNETKDFLRWLENDHFIFLGFREYNVEGEKEQKVVSVVPNSGLGVLRDIIPSRAVRSFVSLRPEAQKLALSSEILIISKTNTFSNIHRPAYTDYIGIKKFSDSGKLLGERRFIGLYTSAAYYSNPKYIPFVRRKVALILKNANLPSAGHAGKELVNILNTFPRDDLFQASSEELGQIAMGILHLQERKRIRLFARKDINGRFFSCLIYVPREGFTTDLAQAMQEILLKAFHGYEISYTTWFSDSALARLHYVVRIDPSLRLKYNLKEIENKLIEVGRSWKDELKENLLEYYGEEKGNLLYQKYQNAFPAGYREQFNPRAAIYDIEHIESLTPEEALSMGFYRPLEEASGTFRFKLFKPDEFIPLSDAIPIFENMGLRVIAERPYEISLHNSKKAWISDYSMEYANDIIFEIEDIKHIFQDAFYHIWNGDAENDRFNRLVLKGKLSWSQISVIRAYWKYLTLTESTYSQVYVEECFNKHPELATSLIQLFLLRFSIEETNREEALARLEIKIKKELDAITILDEDRILRRFYETINATLRTNYFLKMLENVEKPYLSFKLDSTLVPGLPLPLPLYEIFVYSPSFEGIHLRTSKVARGGIRWSDRREDYRTEILGLMKAQNVKNALIVPSGAKGGFIVKNLPHEGTRESIMEEVINCYKRFISGLLDITDNIEGGEVLPPRKVVRYDDDDPYLVVAADKGTTTFSDIANAIAEEYQFWLGDAFASGGSTGYDHKKMGITARGGWESVKRHFRELGRDIQKEDFTVVGIGDMAGDVFGNALLLSQHIKLVGAFNHQHIFLDPNPNKTTSYEERERLFNLPRSTWDDYNRNLISKGGGVYPRTAKAIKLTSEVKELLNIKKDFIVPNELIQELLKTNVDLLWNGGIGTFVKAKDEINSNVGDRTNDTIRVNGEDLKCLVVGEGGNLGFTQLGRVEYAINNGHIYTDFIDNSGGVDCSDREVNLKILLNDVVKNGDMTIKQRNLLLAEMQNEVAQLVLHDNYRQTEAISLIVYQAFQNVDLDNRYIQELVRQGNINLELEFLPNEQELMARKGIKKGLTTPEIAILFAYSKIILKKEILQSDIPEDPRLADIYKYAFPKIINEKFHHEMEQHQLRREIIATLISNAIVNEMGFTFIYQLQSETNATIANIVRAYSITHTIFDVAYLWQEIEKLDYIVPASIQLEMLSKLSRLVRRATRWFLKNRQFPVDIKKTSEHFSSSINRLYSKLSNLLMGEEKLNFEMTKERYMAANVPMEVAEKLAAERAMVSALDIIEAADLYHFELEEMVSTYFSLGETLELGWLREQINAQVVENEWEELAKDSCRDDLDWQQRNLTIAVLQESKAFEEKLNTWLSNHKSQIKRWHLLVNNLRNTSSPNFTMYLVILHELLELTQAGGQTQTNSIIRHFEKKRRKPRTSNKAITQTGS